VRAPTALGKEALRRSGTPRRTSCGGPLRKTVERRKERKDGAQGDAERRDPMAALRIGARMRGAKMSRGNQATRRKKSK